MNDVIINVNEKTGVAYKKYLNQKLGNQHQHLQNKLKFEFIDEVVEGIAWLEYEIDGNKNYALMEKYEKGYQIDIKSCLLISDHVEVDIKITQDVNPNGIPVFVSSIVTYSVEKTINAEEEEPEQYPNWFENAIKITDEASNLDLDVSKSGNTSTITITKKDGTQKSVEVYDGTDEEGNNGATFTPSVSEEGIISWTNDKGLVNPTPINIKGPQGIQGETGPAGTNGTDGISISSIVQTTTSTESGGTNVITATLSDGTTSNFNIMNGAKGDRGQKGETGEQGPQGIEGPQGPAGTPGKSATIQIGSVTTLDAGSEATVTNVGTENEAIFNFGIPKGEPGSGGGGTGNVSSTSINSIEVVDTLPETEVEGVLYLVKETPTEPTNLWVNPTVLTGHYIGSTSGTIGTQEIGYTAYIPCESNTTYKITRTMSGYRFTIASYSSVPKEGSTTTNVTNASDLSEVTFVTGASDTYLAIYYFGGSETLDATELLNDIVVTKVENLYDYTTATVLNTYISQGDGEIGSEGTTGDRVTYLAIEPNTTYKVTKTLGARFVLGTCPNTPTYNTALTTIVKDYTTSELTITSGSSDNYLAIFYCNTGEDTLSEEELRKSIFVTKVQ